GAAGGGRGPPRTRGGGGGGGQRRGMRPGDRPVPGARAGAGGPPGGGVAPGPPGVAAPRGPRRDLDDHIPQLVAGHAGAPPESDAPSDSFNRISPVRIRVLIVPRGSLSRAAISLWERPS